MSTGLLSSALAAFAAAVQPLRAAIASTDSLHSFVAQFGWDLAPADLELVRTALSDLASLSSDPDSLDFDHLTTEVAAIGSALRRISQSGAPAGFVASFPRELLDRLVYLSLAQRTPKIFSALHFVGVLSERTVPADATTGRSEYLSRSVHWDRLSTLVEQPAATLGQTYGWGTQFDAIAFLRSVGALARSFGGRAGLQAADPRLVAQYFAKGAPDAGGTTNLVLAPPDAQVPPTSLATPEAGSLALLVLPIPANPTGNAADGIALIPAINGRVSETIALSDSLSMKLGGDLLARPIRAEIHPDHATLRAAPGDVHVGASLRLDATRPAGAPWIAFGDADSSRLEITSAHASLAVDGQLDGGAEVRVEIGIDAAALVIDFGKSDGFLQQTIASKPTRTAISFAMSWSSVSGFAFGGQPKVQLSLPMHESLGSIATLSQLDLALGAGPNGSIYFDTLLSGTTSIGPVTASFLGTGMRLQLEQRSDAQPTGNLGNFNLQFGFKPPSGVGLSLDAHGVLSGGGFLFHDEAQGLYAGAMQLSLHEQLTLKAFGLIATRMPDGSAGYSLLIFITAEDFRPIQLGLGFTLLGIGGMVAVNRTFDVEVLRQGLQNDTLATLLFPRDPVGNAPALIQALASAFPARRGSYLLGLLAKIGWFTPTLVLMDLALIVEFGSRTRLLALGRISAKLPSADNDLVRLNLDAMADIDFDAETLAIDAVLIDSRLVHKFVITGGGALRAGFGAGADSTFVLSMGGLHPHFSAPAAFPHLERLTMALSKGSNPRIVCESYFAITANTLQFGARASLYAGAAGFSVEGDIGYDVLIQLAPLHFIADFDARLQLKRGSSSLFMVEVAGQLEGPRPLRLTGKATFKIWFVHFSVRFDATLIDGELPPPPPAIDVFALLSEALLAPANWSTRNVNNAAHGVALRTLPTTSGADLLLDPLGQLTVQQQVVPLNTARDLDIFGGAPISGLKHFALSASSGSGALENAALSAPFAPAQYFSMSDDEKLAAPSFEMMQSGCVFGTAATQFDERPTSIIGAPLDYQTIVIGEDVAAAKLAAAATTPYTMSAEQLQSFSRSGSVARAALRRVARARFRNAAAPAPAALNPKRWSIVPRAAGAAATLAPELRTWSEYHAVLKSLNRDAARWQLVPAHEMQP